LNSYESLAIEFEAAFLKEEVDAGLLNLSSDHKSMNDYRPPDELKLTDCIKAFSESEILDDDNPWFCPSCCSNQRAQKSLSIWRTPDTLMVYLKRFIFHDLMSIKVDDPVSFQLDDFDLSPYINETAIDTAHSQMYSLQSCVCHYGGRRSANIYFKCVN